MKSDAARGREEGLALGLVVVVTTALALMAHAALVLARTGRWLVEVEANRVEALSAAEAALNRVSSVLDSLPGTGLRPTEFGVVRVTRPGPELALLTTSPTGSGEEIGRAHV